MSADSILIEDPNPASSRFFFFAAIFSFVSLILDFRILLPIFFPKCSLNAFITPIEAFLIFYLNGKELE
ncbi:hypothetical protein DB43_FS00170 [Parachlamydia acanthamoebae]|uniref:Uncharacterized protein n=1 Tax=Parachlamydia acanthamoebae TaxID=83552 RepID=A0A0C1C2F1_9BACT|nr:hypothetical protein DB43_FS00170 [Parachlamydia acanthamoebae]